MSGPRAIAELLANWTRGVSLTETAALERLHAKIAAALEEARSSPPCLDRRCIGLVLTKLEEAEHWVFAAQRVAIDRADRERREEEGGDGPENA